MVHIIGVTTAYHCIFPEKVLLLAIIHHHWHHHHHYKYTSLSVNPYPANVEYMVSS